MRGDAAVSDSHRDEGPPVSQFEEILRRLVHQAPGGSGGEDPLTRFLTAKFEVYRRSGQSVITGEIAKQLFASPHSIDYHPEKIRRKFDIKNGHELLQHATR